MKLARFDPFSDLVIWRTASDRFRGDRVWPAQDGESLARTLPVNIYDTPDELVVRADLPGVSPDDVEITIEQGRLSIKATRARSTEEADGTRWLRHELWAGDYARVITLPKTAEADKVSANCEHGVLTLSIPKAETAKPRQIKVEAVGK
jgi:HSP20 family protein